MVFCPIQKLHRSQLLLLLLLLLLELLPANGFLQPTRVFIRTRLSFRFTGIMASSVGSGAPVDDGETQRTSTKRRGLRRQIPFVESFEEQTLRELWEENPFRGAEHVVFATIGSETTTNGSATYNPNYKVQAILAPVKDSFIATHEKRCRHEIIYPSSPSPFPPLYSGYEDSFDRIYNRTDNSGGDSNRSPVTSRNGIVGTASIAASPFAVVAETNETKKDKQRHFCLRVAYEGEAFCGWQTQLNNFEKPSVQRTLEEWLTELQNDQPLDAERNAEMKRQKRMEKKERKRDPMTSTSEKTPSFKPVVTITHTIKNNEQRKCKDDLAFKIKWADLPVAGRTDAGVSAIGQICRFRTYRKDLNAEKIQEYLDERVRNSPDISRSLRVTNITRVTKAFHPTFTTTCRAYAYLIDVKTDDSSSPLQPQQSGSDGDRRSSLCSTRDSAFGLLGEERALQQVALLDGMLRQIEGKSLDFIGLSYGKVKTSNTMCTLYHARARLVEYNSLTSDGAAAAAAATTSGKTTKIAVCIELVGDRFLRRMVRLLVEASLRLVAIADATNERANANIHGKGNNKDNEGTNSEDSLLKLIERQDRSLVGRPAPPNGLVFVGARLQSK